MWRQYPSRTLIWPSGPANTTSLVPNAVMPCGVPSRKDSASPRQCQPLAKRVIGMPASISRTCSAAVIGTSFSKRAIPELSTFA